GGGGLPVIEREDALLPVNDGCGVAKGRKSSSLRHISAANHRATGRLMSPRPRWADRLGLPNGAGKQLKGKVPEPLVAGVTVVTLVPELGDLDTRQCDRGFERKKAERPREALLQIGRQSCHAIRLRRNNGAGNEARHAQHDIGGCDRGWQHAMRGGGRGVSGLRSRPPNVV